jgi:hypothetical protein
VVTRVGNKERAGGIHGYRKRIVQCRRRSLATITAEASNTIPRHGGDDSIGGDSADATVSIIGNKERASNIHGHTHRTVQRRRRSRAAIATVIDATIPRYGGDGCR